MFVAQILCLALIGRCIVQYDAPVVPCAVAYAGFFLVVALIFGDRFAPALAARTVGGLCAACWLWILSRANGLVFIPVAGLSVAIPFLEGHVFEAVQSALRASG